MVKTSLKFQGKLQKGKEEELGAEKVAGLKD